jgi:Protein of unknown function (DUF4058)
VGGVYPKGTTARTFTGPGCLPMIAAIYQRSRYERSIDYTKPLTPPLSPDEAAWLQRQLQSGSSQK